MRCFNSCYFQELKLVRNFGKIAEGEFFEVPVLHSDFDFVFSQKGVWRNFTFHGDDFYSGGFGFLERVGKVRVGLAVWRKKFASFHLNDYQNHALIVSAFAECGKLADML